MKTSGRCFACGRDNPYGLRLQIRRSGAQVEVEFTPPAYLQGWDGILHGGITSTVLDELMAWACNTGDVQTVTAELQVRYRRPIPVGASIHGYGKVISRHGRLIIAVSKLFDSRDRLLAEATGKMMVVESVAVPTDMASG